MTILPQKEFPNFRTSVPQKVPECVHSPISYLGEFSNQIFTPELKEHSRHSIHRSSPPPSLPTEELDHISPSPAHKERGREEAKLTVMCGNREPWREEAHRQRARAQLDAVFTHSNTAGLERQL